MRRCMSKFPATRHKSPFALKGPRCILLAVLILTFCLTGSAAEATTTTSIGANLLQDPGFETSLGSTAYWEQSSTNFGSPLCNDDSCGTAGGSAGPRTGSIWAWFGGTANTEAASLSQAVTIPAGAWTLEFYFWIGSAHEGSDNADIFTACIDNSTVFTADATQAGLYPSYTLVSVDVSAWADGASHLVAFSSITTGQVVNFNLDDVALLLPVTTTTTTPPTTTTVAPTTTTTVEPSTTTTVEMETTTTTSVKAGPCPATQVLGAGNPQLDDMRAFRDSALAQSALGRKVTSIYYRKAGSINAALEERPMLRALARRAFEIIAPE